MRRFDVQSVVDDACGPHLYIGDRDCRRASVHATEKNRTSYIFDVAIPPKEEFGTNRRHALGSTQ